MSNSLSMAFSLRENPDLGWIKTGENGTLVSTSSRIPL